MQTSGHPAQPALGGCPCRLCCPRRRPNRASAPLPGAPSPQKLRPARSPPGAGDEAVPPRATIASNPNPHPGGSLPRRRALPPPAGPACFGAPARPRATSLHHLAPAPVNQVPTERARSSLAEDVAGAAAPVAGEDEAAATTTRRPISQRLPHPPAPGTELRPEGSAGLRALTCRPVPAMHFVAPPHITPDCC